MSHITDHKGQPTTLTYNKRGQRNRIERAGQTIDITYGVDPVRWTVSDLILKPSGATWGAVGAPELDRHSFRRPALWQVTFAVCGSIVATAW